ncbi:MAG: glycosyltransferase family 2 protein, partial [Desulfuromonadales bacterium]|nr:glycosyltransferase family 2 protein [Desulfuromonadales bacterium]
MARLSVVIPVYNEINYIVTVLQRVQAVDLPDLTLEMVIVDDASRDGTRELLQGLARQRQDDPDGIATVNGAALQLAPLRIIFQEVNQGKGAALRRGFSETTGDIILVQDADFEYDPAEYPKLLAPILVGKADVVFGSRFVGGDAHRVLYYWHSVGNRLLTLASNLFTNLNLSDMEC